MPELLEYLQNHNEAFRGAQLHSLYSDFRLQSSSNPDGYRANCNAWIAGLSKAAADGKINTAKSPANTLAITFGQELLDLLETPQHGQPAGINAALSEGVRLKAFIPIAEFLSLQRSVYDAKWTLNPYPLLAWSLGRLGLSESKSCPPGSQLAILRNIERAADRITAQLGQQPRRIDRTYPVEDFKRRCAKILGLDRSVSDIDTSLLLKFLYRDKSEAVYNDKVVVFRGTTRDNLQLSIEDDAVASIKTLLSATYEQVKNLTSKLFETDTRLHARVATTDRSGALRTLKQKKLLEKALEERGSRLIQLEGVLGDIGQAADQVELLNVLKGSTSALRHLNQEAEELHKAEDWIDQGAEVRAESEAVGHAMADISDQSQDAELDEELDEMLAEIQRRADQKASNNPDGQKLPHVPQTALESAAEDGEPSTETSSRIAEAV